MKTMLTYGLIGIALVANATANEVIPKEPLVIPINEEYHKLSSDEKTKVNEEMLNQVMTERMRQICKVLDIDSSSLTKDQMAELLNKVEEL